jgi:hypothetical protein
MKLQTGTVIIQKKLLPITSEGIHNKIGNKFKVIKTEFYQGSSQNVFECRSTDYEFGFFGGIDEIEEYFEEYVESNKDYKLVEKDDGTKIIKNDKAVIIILKDGTKGVSKCHPDDTFDLIKGEKIAYNRAMIKYLTKQLKKLTK